MGEHHNPGSEASAKRQMSLVIAMRDGAAVGLDGPVTSGAGPGGLWPRSRHDVDNRCGCGADSRGARRDNVRLVTAPITRITGTGVETTAGHEDVDVLVFATGFHTNRVLWPIQITGKDGVICGRSSTTRPRRTTAWRSRGVRTC
jgi:glycine/D-amino acid oxidase-like deaminating enzyme